MTLKQEAFAIRSRKMSFILSTLGEIMSDFVRRFKKEERVSVASLSSLSSTVL